MSRPNSVVRLEQALMRLDAALDDVILMVGDLPECVDEPAIADALRDRAVEIRGELDTAVTAARAMALAEAHAAFNAVARSIRLELAVPSNTLEIVAVAASRGGAWLRWSEVVRQSLDEVGAACEPVSQAVLDCWCELAAQYRIPHWKEMPHV